MLCFFTSRIGFMKFDVDVEKSAHAASELDKGEETYSLFPIHVSSAVRRNGCMDGL